jgi:hypothetical protein
MSNPTSSATAAAAASTTAATLPSWDMPANSSAFFPKDDNDRLANEAGYFVWAHRMQKALQYCGLWNVVSGATHRPSPGATDEQIWIKMDIAASVLITQCIKGELVVKIIHLPSSKAAWDLFVSEYSQIGSGSIMYWFARLTRHMIVGGDVSAHINDYQEAIRYLANANFSIPEPISAAILLSTLPSDPKDPESWDYFIKGVKIDQLATTTLSSVINQILEEKRRQSPTTDSAQSEAALAAKERTARATGTKFCQNCKRDGHEILVNCWAPGGGKEGQGPRRKRKKEKDKEKANVPDEGGDESSNVVFEKCLAAREVTFAYSSCETGPIRASPTPQAAEDSVYSARTTSSTAPIIDSSATSHIFADRLIFSHYQLSSGKIDDFGDGQSSIRGCGDAKILAHQPSGDSASIKLQNSYHVPNSSFSIVSVSRLDDANCYILFGAGCCITFESTDDRQMVEDLLAKSKKILLTVTRRPDRLYYLDVPRSRLEKAYPAYVLPTSKLEKFHRKLGHLNYSCIRSLVRKDLVMGIALTKEELEIEPPVCAACMMGKITRASFLPSESGRASQFLALIHSDLWGPAPVQSISGSQYMIAFTDDFSRWVWIYFLWRKSDAFAVFKQWKVQVEKESGKSIRIFRTDDSGEYFSNVWTSYTKDEGVCWETTTSRTPEQNGISKRLNRSIVGRVRTILIDAGLSLHLWTEAVNYIVYTKNQNPTHAIPITPSEKCYNRKPDISRLHHFGCVACVLDDADLRDSFLAEGEYQLSYRSLKSSISSDSEENSSQEPVSIRKTCICHFK